MVIKVGQVLSASELLICYGMVLFLYGNVYWEKIADGHWRLWSARGEYFEIKYHDKQADTYIVTGIGTASEKGEK